MGYTLGEAIASHLGREMKTANPNLNDNVPLLFIVPPLTTIAMPEIGVSLLKTRMANQKSRILYSNIRLAEMCGVGIHAFFSYFIGEQIFAHLLFPEHMSRDALNKEWKKVLPNFLRFLPLEKINTFLFEDVRRFEIDFISYVTKLNPKIIALPGRYTTHNLSVIWLAKILKNTLPNVSIVVGGTAYYGEMGKTLFKLFSYLDYVIQGEADESFPALVKELITYGELTKPIPGVLNRKESISFAPAVLPTSTFVEPDLSDYFTQLKNSRITKFVTPALVMETSRGCWWGCKNPCVFCGMWGALGVDDDIVPYRDKNPENVLAEVHNMTKKYRPRHIFATDALLSTRLYGIFPRLPSIPGMSFHFEIKSNIGRDTLVQMREHHVRSIGPGIESFCNKTLRAMNKGVTATQNLQTIKWATELGFNIHYFILSPVIGDSPADIMQMISLIKRIHHFSPPRDLVNIQIARFSTYQTRSTEYGLEPLKVEAWMSKLYPFSDEELQKIASHFSSETYQKLTQSNEQKKLRRAYNKWLSTYYKSFLVGIPLKRTLFIFDSRSCRSRLFSHLKGLDKDVVQFCDKARLSETIYSYFESQEAREKIKIRLQKLERRNLIVHIDNRYLSLVNYVDDNFTKILSEKQKSFLGYAPSSLRERLTLGSYKQMLVRPFIAPLIILFEIVSFSQKMKIGYKMTIAFALAGILKFFNKLKNVE